MTCSEHQNQEVIDDRKFDTELCWRMKIMKRALQKLNKIIRDRKISSEAEKSVVNWDVISDLLSGNEF